jgi:outer membrane protein OmpA-like peptidoglycan-associated protein
MGRGAVDAVVKLPKSARSLRKREAFMRVIFSALALLAFFTAPTLAQDSVEAQMSRAERELRDSMAPAGAEVQRTAPDEIRVRMPSDITFDFNRANVRYEFMPRVHDLSRTLNNYPMIAIEIVGHADAIGSDDYNMELSQRRARAVGAILLNDGVSYGRIDVSGRGEWEPIASNANEWGRAQNRRVEIRLSAKPK